MEVGLDRKNRGRGVETRRFGVAILAGLLVFAGAAFGWVKVRSLQLDFQLQEAAADYDTEGVRRLLAQGAHPNACDSTVLGCAFGLPTGVLEVLLSDPRVRLDVRDRYGSSPLTAALNCDDVYGLAALIRTRRERGLEMRDARDRLVYAAAEGDAARVRQLLDAGVPADWGEIGYPPPLLAAALMNHTEVVRLLLARGADPGRRYRADAALVPGRNALDVAARAGRSEPARVLFRAGATFDGSSLDFETLSAIVGFSSETEVAMLRAALAAPNQRGFRRSEYRALVRWARERRRPQAARLLERKLVVRWEDEEK